LELRDTNNTVKLARTIDSDAIVLAGEPAGGSAPAVIRDQSGCPMAWRLVAPGMVSLSFKGETIEGEITTEDIDSILAWQDQKNEDIPVDCEHLLYLLAQAMGVEETEIVRQAPILGEKAAAGFVRLARMGDELWAQVKTWSPRARELLTGTNDGIYRYFSPSFRGLQTPPLRITSIALSNVPLFNSLPALDALAASYDAALATWNATNTEKTPMKDLITKLAALCNLDAAAFADEKADLKPLLTAAHAALQTGSVALTGFLAKIKDSIALADGATLDTAAGLIVSLAAKQKADALALAEAQTKIDAFQKADFTRLVDDLKAKGKLTDAMIATPWFKGLDHAALSAFAEAAPTVVPMGRGPKAIEKAGDDNVMTAAGMSVARACGLDPAAVAGHCGLKMPA
jgi:hypothetical protein